MTELFDEDVEELLQDIADDVVPIVVPMDNDPLHARRRLEDLFEEKRLREELEDI